MSPLEDAIDGLGTEADDLDGIPPQDVEEILDAVLEPDEDVEKPVEEADLEQPTAMAPPPPPTQTITGPSVRGYFRDTVTDRDVCRVSGPFKNSMAVRCYLHRKCTLAIGVSRMPSNEEIREWIRTVRPGSPADDAATAAMLREEHIGRLRALLRASGSEVSASSSSAAVIP